MSEYMTVVQSLAGDQFQQNCYCKTLNFGVFVCWTTSNTVLLTEHWIFAAHYFCEFAQVAKFAK